jgi:hypothetical protein
MPQALGEADFKFVMRPQTFGRARVALSNKSLTHFGECVHALIQTAQPS